MHGVPRISEPFTEFLLQGTQYINLIGYLIIISNAVIVEVLVKKLVSFKLFTFFYLTDKKKDFSI